jgi:NAD(P)-dependent dehydrogenase (short-subunit alcohol dehydrogenase family)
VIEERGDPGRRLAGKVAVIVGGGQTPGDTIGNGKATAQLFAHHGARVVVVDRAADRAQETVSAITRADGEAVACVANVTSEEAGAAMMAAATDPWGRVDIVHYNVGIGSGDLGVQKTTLADWNAIHDVNLTGAFLTSQAAIPALREAGGGSMLFTSSIASIAGVNMSAYKTSKAGLNALAHSLAVSNARHGVRVNSILPGLMDTPMAIEGISTARGVTKDELRSARDASVPLGRKMGTAWDIAYAALWLASDEARFVTGIELVIDGGQLARIG